MYSSLEVTYFVFHFQGLRPLILKSSPLLLILIELQFFLVLHLRNLGGNNFGGVIRNRLSLRLKLVSSVVLPQFMRLVISLDISLFHLSWILTAQRPSTNCFPLMLYQGTSLFHLLSHTFLIVSLVLCPIL